jgi:hypothetical protein
MASIKVAVRMRPMNARERDMKDGAGVVSFGDDGQSVGSSPHTLKSPPKKRAVATTFTQT